MNAHEELGYRGKVEPEPVKPRKTVKRYTRYDSSWEDRVPDELPYQVVTESNRKARDKFFKELYGP